MSIFEIKEWPYGTINSVVAERVPDGAAFDSNNFITTGRGGIELRRGYSRLGTTENTTGPITGLCASVRLDGTQVLYRTRLRKIEYLDTVTDDWIEIGTNALPVAASGEDVSIENYLSLAGSATYLSSRHSSIYKIMNSNPGDYTDLLSTTYRGKIIIRRNRMFLWDRVANAQVDKTRLHLSYIDKDEISDFTLITAEALGSSGSLTYSGTLAFKGAGAKRTCFAVSITDTSENFYDNGSGVLVGSAGGTGTINYTTGAYSVTFAVAAVGSVTATYNWEDSTSTGIADFSYSSPTRTAGQGLFLIQNEGGAIQNVLTYDEVEYCLHENAAWALTIGRDDTSATNLLFRSKVGIPNWRAAVATGRGIYYVDDIDENDPHFRLLQVAAGSTELVPISISKQWKLGSTMAGVNLEDYRFDRAACLEWGDFVIFACRQKDSIVNNTMFLYNVKLRTIDRTDYFASTLAIYNGTLVAGDSINGNVYTLFSGTDDDSANIDNSWIGNISELGMPRMKKTHRPVVEGLIGINQVIDFYASLDRGTFVLVDSVRGDSLQYVDRSEAVYVGGTIIGHTEIGGGGTGIEAYHYRKEMTWHSDKFRDRQWKIVASGLGFASVSRITDQDLRQKDVRINSRYRQTA